MFQRLAHSALREDHPTSNGVSSKDGTAELDMAVEEFESRKRARGGALSLTNDHREYKLLRENQASSLLRAPHVPRFVRRELVRKL